MSRKITKRQQQIYDFIRSYQKEKGYPPSVREMAAAPSGSLLHPLSMLTSARSKSTA